MTATVRDSEEPLLPRQIPIEKSGGGTSNLTACTLSLVKAIIGAGMMALPRACALLGVYVGFGFLGIVGGVTWFSVSKGMVHPATSLADRSRGAIPCYSTLVFSYLGETPSALLTFFILANNLGAVDVLLGSGGRPGILFDLAAALKSPDWFTEHALSRPIFLAVFMICVIGPLGLRRKLSDLDNLNIMGLIALTALGLSVIWLAAAAVLQGKAKIPPFWPDTDTISKGSGDNWMLGALSLLPVLLTADSCHLNIMPLAEMIRPFNRKCMDRVVAITMVICTMFYSIFAAAAVVAFGSDTHEDVLENLRADAMAPLLGPVQAYFVAYIVRIAYVISLLGSIAICLFPLRDALISIACKRETSSKEAMKEKYFASMTIGILVLVYFAAAYIPSIWAIVGFLGGVSSPGVCFIFPAMVMIAYCRSQCQMLHWVDQLVYFGGGAVLIFVGAGIAFNCILRPL